MQLYAVGHFRVLFLSSNYEDLKPTSFSGDSTILVIKEKLGWYFLSRDFWNQKRCSISRLLSRLHFFSFLLYFLYEPFSDMLIYEARELLYTQIISIFILKKRLPVVPKIAAVSESCKTNEKQNTLLKIFLITMLIFFPAKT